MPCCYSALYYLNCYRSSLVFPPCMSGYTVDVSVVNARIDKWIINGCNIVEGRIMDTAEGFLIVKKDEVQKKVGKNPFPLSTHEVLNKVFKLRLSDIPSNFLSLATTKNFMSETTQDYVYARIAKKRDIFSLPTK